MDIHQRLCMITEGAVESTSIQESDDYDNEDIMSEAAYEIFLVEAEMLSESTLSLGDLFMEAVIAEASGDAVQKQSVWTKIKAKLVALKQKFDVYDGLRELKLVNELVKDDKSTFGGDGPISGVIGLALTVYARASKYKNFDKDLAKQYLSEAQEFKSKLQRRLSHLDKSKDKAKYKRTQQQIAKLEKHIDLFERRAVDKAPV